MVRKQTSRISILNCEKSDETDELAQLLEHVPADSKPARSWCGGCCTSFPVVGSDPSLCRLTHPSALWMLAMLFAADGDDDEPICLSSVSCTADGWGTSTFLPGVNDAACLTRVSQRSSSLIDSLLVMQVATPTFESTTPATLSAGSFSGDCAEMNKAHYYTPLLDSRQTSQARM